MAQKILEDRGYFWWHDDPLPDNQFAADSCVVGTLIIHENGKAHLELDGYFPSNKDGPMAALVDRGQPFPPDKAIQGKLKNCGRSVLLLGLRRQGGRFSSNGISHEGFDASNCLVTDGSFPPANRPLKFSALDIDLTGLEEWLRLGNVEVKRTRSRISVKHRLPKPDVYDLVDGTLTMRYDITGPWTGKHTRRMDKLDLVESVNLRFKPKRTQSLIEMRDEYARMQDLFILLTGSNYSLEWPRLISGRQSYRYYFEGFERSKKAPTWDECWANYVQLKSTFGAIVSAWRREREEFGPGFYLYLGIRRGIKMYVEHRFVNLIWGLESLHRRKDNGKVAGTKLDAKIQRILGQIGDKRDRKWLEGRLKHASEPSLAERLVDVLSLLPFNFDAKLLRAFCEACADRRNDVSHFGGQRHNGDYRTFIIDVAKKTEALAHLYHAVLLYEIGVDPDLLKQHVFEGPSSYRVKYALSDVGLLPSADGKPAAGFLDG